MLLLCSNNYLGLADHPQVREAAAEAAMRWGAGAGASRLISRQHGAAPPAGGAAGRVQGLRGGAAVRLRLPRQHRHRSPPSPARGEVVFSDELNHASIVDGCRLSRAETFVYRHGDLEHLAWGLREAGGRGALIVTDGVFSMDGDVAPLPELLELARRHGCRLMVDEAHATGALGPGGRGSVAAAGLSGEVDVVVGTLGKALGSYGAYVCAGAETIDFLVNTARPFIFSTAPPPPSVAAAAAALELRRPSRPGRALQANAARFRAALAAEGLGAGRSQTQIVPVEVGDAEPTMELCERAPRARRLRPGDPPADRARGLLAPALHGDGHATSRRAGAAPRSWSAPRPASSAWPRLAPLAA